MSRVGALRARARSMAAFLAIATIQPGPLPRPDWKRPAFCQIPHECLLGGFLGVAAVGQDTEAHSEEFRRGLGVEPAEGGAVPEGAAAEQAFDLDSVQAALPFQAIIPGKRRRET